MNPKPILFFDHLKNVNKELEKDPDILSDKLWRIQNLYPIQDKKGQVIPFFLNVHQLKLLELVKRNWGKFPPDPIVVLKSRQVGITTFFCIWFLDDVLTYSGISAGIQAHKHDSLQGIFRNVRFAYDNMHPIYKTKETDRFSTSTKTEILIGENNSMIEVKLEIRSKAINRILFSEKAFIEDERDTATQGSLAPGCLEVHESTPKGLNKFHKIYRTHKPLGNTFFIPWWKHDEYAVPCPKGLEDKTLEEIRIQKEYPEITDEKLMFRRKKLNSMQLLEYEQEFPLNDVECFLLSGASILDRRLLAKIEKEAEKTKPLEVLRLPNFEVIFYQKPTLEEVLERPRAFYIGIDTAEGIGQDYSVTVVLAVDVKNNYKVSQVMVGRGFLPPDEQAMETYRLIEKHYVFDGVWPFLVCERNNTGHAFISTMRTNPNYLYPNLYSYQDRRLGFKTTAVSKKIILHDLFNAIRDGSFEIKDLNTISELFTLTLTESGKIEAEEGEHDDLVIANALAYHGFFQTLGRGRIMEDMEKVMDMGDVFTS